MDEREIVRHQAKRLFDDAYAYLNQAAALAEKGYALVEHACSILMEQQEKEEAGV